MLPDNPIDKGYTGEKLLTKNDKNINLEFKHKIINNCHKKT